MILITFHFLVCKILHGAKHLVPNPFGPNGVIEVIVLRLIYMLISVIGVIFYEKSEGNKFGDLELACAYMAFLPL